MPEPSSNSCPECASGKCVNCTRQVLMGEQYLLCACAKCGGGLHARLTGGPHR